MITTFHCRPTSPTSFSLTDEQVRISISFNPPVQIGSISLVDASSTILNFQYKYYSNNVGEQVDEVSTVDAYLSFLFRSELGLTKSCFQPTLLKL